MLTNALSINYLVKQLFLETFYLKNDKTINTVDNFLYFLCYENAVKISNYSLLTISLSTYVNMTLNYFSLLFTCSFKIHINFIFPYSQKKLFFLFSSLRVTMLYFFEIWKINKCPKSISLEIIFRNFLWEKKKVIDFFTNFYIFHKSGIKIFLQLSINICSKWY